MTVLFVGQNKINESLVVLLCDYNGGADGQIGPC